MNLFQRYLADEFAEDYQEGRLSRREALKLIASVTGSMLVANSILAACTPTDETALPSGPVTPAQALTEPAATAPAAGTVPPEDDAVIASDIEFPGTNGETLLGYLAQPSSGAAAPVILVCHENRGLTTHIQDVTRRLAKAGYVALAIDLLSRQGGSASVGESNVPGALGNISPDQFVADFKSGWQYLSKLSFAQANKVGMTGFCFGGGVTWLVATRMPELLAAVPFYGPHPPLEDVPNIQAAVLAIYGELDTRIGAGIPEIEAAMQENQKVFEKVIYPNADHAFHNDTGSRYNPEAAKDAWARTLAWFEKYVRTA